MSRIEYETFDVVITSKNGKGTLYNVVAHGHRGEQTPNPIEFHVDEVNLPGNEDTRNKKNTGEDLRHLSLGDDDGTIRYPLLWHGPPNQTRARAFGGRLFRAVFKDSVRDLFARCRTLAQEKRANLRMRFDLSQSPQLAVWPWECLYYPDLREFLAMFEPIIRYIPNPNSEVPLEVVAPLRILVVVSLPEGVTKLDAEGEISGIRAATKDLSDQNLLELEVLKEASLSVLLRKLERAKENNTPFHILHYIGHGIFDPATNEGKLLLTGENGSRELVDGDQIGSHLKTVNDHLRLVILNACEGARLSRIDTYAGVAQRILQSGGIPAVLAMQFRITDKAAVTFARLFYENLAASKPLEHCLARARLQMYGENQNEWVTPVIYMHASDGHILQVQPPPRVVIPGPGAPPSSLTSHYKEIEEALDEGQLIIFLGLNVNLYGRQLIPKWSPGSVLPGNSELFDYLIRTHHYRLAGAPLASIAQRLVVNKKKRQLYNALAHTFDDPKLALPALYSVLARVVGSVRKKLQELPDPLRRRPIILTANYDKSVERAFGEQGIDDYHVISYSLKTDQVGEFQHTRVERGKDPRVTPIGDHNKETVLTGYHPVIIKLPGAVESGSTSYAVTEDHFFYLSRKGLIAMLPSQLVAALKTSQHLYLGYDVQDWPFRALLYAIWEDLKPRSEAWAVIPDIDDPNKAYWDSCGVDVIQTPLESYVAGLEQYLLRPERKGQ